jgi:integrase
MLNDKSIPALRRKAMDTGKRQQAKDQGTGAVRGLWLRFSPSGEGSWSVQTSKPDGAMIRLKVGDFRPPSAPEGSQGMSLKDARAKARETKQQIHDGIDPNAERKAARAGNPDAVTIAKLFELREAAPRINRTWKEYKRAISQVFAEHLDTPLPQLTRRQLKATANAAAVTAEKAGHKGVGVNRATAYLASLLKWAHEEEHGPEELVGLKKPIKREKPKQRLVDDTKLAGILRAVRQPREGTANQTYNDFVQILIYTMTRRSEPAGMRWCDVHLDAEYPHWVVPDTKNGMEAIIPLSKPAVELLRRRRAAATKGKRPLHLDALVFSTERGTRLGRWTRHLNKLQRDSKTWDWSPHDLRRTDATQLSKALGIAPHVIKAGLNHKVVVDELEDGYNHNRYWHEVREGFEAWAEHLNAIADGSAKPVIVGGRVIPFHRRAEG